MDLKQNLTALLHRADVRMNTVLAKRLANLDLTPEQFTLMSALWKEDGINQRVLGDRIGKDRPNTTRILEKLERKGFIHRATDIGDKRVHHVHLTESGKALAQPAAQAMDAFRSDCFRGLSGSDEAMLFTLIGRLMRNLDRLEEQGPEA
ncbi:MAG: MarR family winged helix-turn-helix transcriptional regulator [Gammaproteobacteria bacterium]